MVTKITLFEPHFDGAQIGPARLDTAETKATADTAHTGEDVDSETIESSRRLPTIRTGVGIASFASLFLAGFMAYRRFKPSGDIEEETAEATIEERPIESVTAE